MDHEPSEKGDGVPEMGASGPAHEAAGPAVPTSAASRVILSGAGVVLTGFVLVQAPILWSEIQGLRRDWERSRISKPIGFVDISPNPSFARAPRPWHRQEGEDLLLWSGWQGGRRGHTWFRVGRDEIELESLHQPFGRDVVRAIDTPIVEVGRGPHWGEMDWETAVISLDHRGTATAYPFLLLQKVEVVNDSFAGGHVLVVHTPFLAPDPAVDVFDPLLNGVRLTFGSSGYMRGPERRPLLYDRETESLWVVDSHTMKCIAGKHRGASLAHITQGGPTIWGPWSELHPDGRLIVGADRAQRQPDRTASTAQVTNPAVKTLVGN